MRARKDVQELIAYAKANPGKLTFGSGSTSSRVAGELLKTMAGIDMLHVPYKSNPQVVTDLLGGQISLFFGDVTTSLPPVAAGRLKGFAVSSLKRSPLAPDLPTLDEVGLPGTISRPGSPRSCRRRRRGRWLTSSTPPCVRRSPTRIFRPSC